MTSSGVVILAIVPAVVLLIIGGYSVLAYVLLKPATPTKQRRSVRCAPEIIRPIVVRGACGLRECRIASPHSHAEDLIRRLKEKRR